MRRQSLETFKSERKNPTGFFFYEYSLAFLTNIYCIKKNISSHIRQLKKEEKYE